MFTYAPRDVWWGDQAQSVQISLCISLGYISRTGIAEEGQCFFYYFEESSHMRVTIYMVCICGSLISTMCPCLLSFLLNAELQSPCIWTGIKDDPTPVGGDCTDVAMFWKELTS
jgi:hypothetical protein